MAAAVNVTDVPSQTLFWLAVIEILAGTTGLTIMFMVLDVAVFPEVQLKLEVIATYTWSPLAGTQV